MNLLFLTHRLPCPPDRGCKVRSAAILHWLAKRHDVWCAGFLDSNNVPELREATERSLTSLRQLCRGVLAVPFRPTLAGYKALASLVAGGTATEGYFGSRCIERGIQQWAQEVAFDAVFAFSSGIARLAERIPARRHVLCMDDLDSRKWQELAAGSRWLTRFMYDTEWRRLAHREREWLARFDATLVISQREADLVSDPRLRTRVHVVPPILPATPSTPLGATAIEAPGLRREAGRISSGPVVGFVGVMDYGPNVDAACWLAREIWPRVRRHCPDARLWIVGRSPTKTVRELSNDESIHVTGTVPSVDEYFQHMRVHVAPLRIARGVQMKVLEAMEAGRPCVATSCVAEGLGARAGRDLLVADSPAVFAQAIIHLLEDPARAETVGRMGQAYVRSMQPDRVMQRVEALLSGDEAPEWKDAEPRRAGDVSPADLRECVSAMEDGGHL